MLKRITALVLAMLLVLSMSTAFAWTCPNCGADMETKFCSECGTKKPENICPGCGTNHGEKVLNFCTECGTKMGAATPAVTPEPAAEEPAISHVFENGDGTISITWEADGQTTYTIECIQRQSDDPWADRSANNGFYTSQGKDNIGFYTISRLIPGGRYWIGLFDEEGRGDFMPFDPVEQPGAFSEFSINVSGQPMIETDGVQAEAAPLTVNDISNGEKVGFYLAMAYDNPGEMKEYITQIVIKASNGAKWVTAGQVKFNAKTAATTGWKFVNLTDYFARMQNCFGTVLMGNYSVAVYVNGALAGEVPFRVEQGAAPTAAPTAEPTATPVPQEEVRARLEDVVSNGDGTVTVSWQGGVAPYKVQYTLKKSDDFNADRSAARESGDYWNAATGVEGTSAVISRLIPGEEYWVVVLDANEKGQRRVFATESSAFTDFPVTMELKPRERIGETPADIACIPADMAGAEDTAAHGVFMKINHDNPGEARDYYMQIVTTFENGFKYVYGTGSVNFASGEGRWHKWEFYSIDDLLVHLRKYYGQIPEGDLTISIYLDGKLACEGTVPVGVQTPLVITGCVQQENGRALLTWEDNGHGPYGVYYHERFSDDAAADRNDGRGTGRWIAEDELTDTSLVIRYLIPGKDYWITLEDSAGGKQLLPFTMASMGDAGMNMTASVSPRMRKGEAVTDLAGFSAAEINQNADTEYGLYVELVYSPLDADMVLPSMWVVTMPNGISFCDYAFDMNVFADGSTYWNYYNLDWAFDQVKRWYGEVLVGEYTFTLYIEGKHAVTTTFTVDE